jgi:hypothetical protein
MTCRKRQHFGAPCGLTIYDKYDIITCKIFVYMFILTRRDMPCDMPCRSIGPSWDDKTSYSNITFGIGKNLVI